MRLHWIGKPWPREMRNGSIVTDAPSLASLFRTTPEQFTSARKQLVAELRRAGKTSAADAVARLPRPTPVVWAINQVAHLDRAAVERLLTAADQLKHAQLGRAGTDLPLSAKPYQDAVAALVERSLAHLRAAGRPTTAATRNRLTGTLLAAAADPALRESLRGGQLAREQTAAGFDVFRDAAPALRAVPGARPPARHDLAVDRNPRPRGPPRTARRCGVGRKRGYASRQRARTSPARSLGPETWRPQPLSWFRLPQLRANALIPPAGPPPTLVARFHAPKPRSGPPTKLTKGADELRGP